MLLLLPVAVRSLNEANLSSLLHCQHHEFSKRIENRLEFAIVLLLERIDSRQNVVLINGEPVSKVLPMKSTLDYPNENMRKGKKPLTTLMAIILLPT